MHQCHQLHATVSEREREGIPKKGGFQPLEETMGIVTGMEFLM